MNIHKNARTTPYSRAEIVRRVMVLRETPRAVATALGVSERTVAKWLARYRTGGEAGLADRSSRPHAMPSATPLDVIEQVIALRRQRITGKQIAITLCLSPATVSRVLRKARLSRMRDLDPPEPVRRYEREHPGELIHIDIKKLGRFDRVGHRITGDRTGQANQRGTRDGKRYGTGWEFVHVCIDDASRIAFSQVLSDEKKESAVAFLFAAIAYYQSLGIAVSRVMTDNGSCYKSFAFRDACKALGLRHIRTRPYTPKTNGKAERFIQTSLREWAYARAYPTSEHRKQALESWLHNYNWHRPHGSLQSRPPASRLAQPMNNLLRLHT
jgi:transposase InsO family protein